MNKDISKLLVEILRDIENTQSFYHGYGYRRTVRNILVGNKDSEVAVNFTNKKYYGIMKNLSLEDTENLLNQLVKENIITYNITEHGKMYCTFSYLR